MQPVNQIVSKFKLIFGDNQATYSLTILKKEFERNVTNKIYGDGNKMGPGTVFVIEQDWKMD